MSELSNPHQPGEPAAPPPQGVGTGAPHFPQPQGQSYPVPHGQSPPPPMPYAGHPAHQVQPRNPILFALASFLIAGLGTMLGGHVGRGLVILCVVWFLAVLMFIPFLGLLVIPFWLGAWAFSVFDGYRTAQRWNQQHGIIS